MRQRVRIKKPLRFDPEFQEFLKKHAKVDKNGKISVDDCYAYLGFNISWKGELVSMTYANAVWFLTHGTWPDDGLKIDHINDDPLDNRPSNLQAITEAENHAKRRGRKVYRSYGKGKYGYGIQVHHDKRDGRFYVSRNVSRGFGEGDLKGIRYGIGGYDSLAEAEAAVAAHKAILEKEGLDYRVEIVRVPVKRATKQLDSKINEMRKLRAEGLPYQKIADRLGLRLGAVYKRLRE